MRKFKKLNRKGFTLIELLAVIVILAIVMGVAANSVLNVMNDSRKNTLQSSAKSAADAFRTAYAEYQLGGTNRTTILGITATDLIKTSATTVALSSAGTNLNLSSNNYDLAKSYVRYNPTTGAFTVCLTASSTGSYYLASAIRTSEVAAGSSPVGVKLEKNTMWACSDDTHSWT